MKRFIKNLENRYIGILILIVGVLMLIFPEQLAKAFPYMLGVGLIIRGIAAIILAVRYKETSQSPGKVIVYWGLGSIIMILGSGSIGIIGVIDAFKVKPFINGGLFAAMLIISTLVILAGIYSFVQPFIFAGFLGILASCCFIVEGIDLICTGCIEPKADQ